MTKVPSTFAAIDQGTLRLHLEIGLGTLAAALAFVAVALAESAILIGTGWQREGIDQFLLFTT